MFRKLLIFLVLSILAMPVAALAGYTSGTKEMTLSGSGGSDKSFDYTTFSVEGSYGYFFTPMVEGIVRQGIGISDNPGDTSWNGSTRLGVDFNFDYGKWVPFLGVNVGYLYGDSVKEQFVAGPLAGFKAYVNDTTFVIAGVEYEFLFEDADDADDSFDDGRFVYTLGLGFKW
jgi:hypothetical protein